jgi:putative peptide zinc metalloprotease protein
MESTLQDDLTGPGDAWLSVPLVLSPGAERLTGADHQPMLYLASQRSYIRLSRGAAGLLDALDGETSAAQILAGVGGDEALRSRRLVLDVIDLLRRAGAFTLDAGAGADLPPRWRRRLAAAPRLRLTRGIDPLVAGPARLIRGRPRAARAAAIAVAVAGVALCLVGALRFSAPAAVLWPTVFAVVLAEVAVHELAHAVVCRVFGVSVREAGIMLWGWFLPLAYVDCTDTYRLARRRPRILVALAGPFVDLTAAAACVPVMLVAGPRLSGTASILFLSLLLMLARNLLPVLPTDGYHALQAAAGELNLRRRSWTHLRAWLAGGARGPRRTVRQRVYIGYGILSAAYTVAMLALVVLEVHQFIRVLG